MKVTIIDGDDGSQYTVDVTPEEAKRLETGTFVVKVNMCLKLGYTRKILFFSLIVSKQLVRMFVIS